MKKTHIVGIVLIAICLGVIVTMLTDASSYANFQQAYANQDQQFHVVGKLNPDKPIDYDPTQNTELLSFYMIDELGVEKQVHLHAAKPQDFERADQIVLIGQVQKDGAFHANDILTKCPSKYDEENKVESTNAQAQY